MNVIMIAPGYPAEMPYFVRGLARAGAKVFGLSDVPEHELPRLAREHLSGYLQSASLVDEEAVVRQVLDATRSTRATIERVICMWEPGVILAAKLREALGVPGMGVEQATLFRDKDAMKQAVGAAGIRVPKHARATTNDEVRAGVEQLGYPAIVKPIAGAGSMDTFRVDDPEQLETALAKMGHIDEVNVEEFIDGEEYTYDTICVDGEIKFFNVGFYRPRPLIARQNEWISPQTLTLRDVHGERVAGGVAMGQAVLKALNFQTGFTHMEWYKKPDGEVVFGEIAARPPGAHTVDLMNYGNDIDCFDGYGEAEIKGTFSQTVERKYNSVNIFKRAEGQGRIRRIEGLDRIRQLFGEWIVHVDLLPVGAPRRDWILTLVSDGYVTLRHPDLEKAQEMADLVGTDLKLHAS
jgi:hypothetical protein